MNNNDPRLAVDRNISPVTTEDAIVQSLPQMDAPDAATTTENKDTGSNKECVYTFSDGSNDGEELKYKTKNTPLKHLETKAVDVAQTTAAACSSSASSVPTASTSPMDEDTFPGFTPPKDPHIDEDKTTSTSINNKAATSALQTDPPPAAAPPSQCSPSPQPSTSTSSPAFDQQIHQQCPNQIVQIPPQHQSQTTASPAQNSATASPTTQPTLRPATSASSSSSSSPASSSASTSPAQPAAALAANTDSSVTALPTPTAALPAAAPPQPTASASCAPSAVAATPPVRRPTNGCIPKTGKPLTFVNAANSNAKSTGTASTAAAKRKAGAAGGSRTTKNQRKVLVTMYQSQISDNTMGGIKLKLKKSSDMAQAVADAATAVAATITGRGAGTTKAKAPRSRAAKGGTGAGGSGNNRKRARRAQRHSSDDDGDDAAGSAADGKEKRVRKSGAAAGKASTSSNNHAGGGAARQPVDQTDWGARLPEPVLQQIFDEVVRQEGALPTLVRLGRVCRLWNRVAAVPSLWRALDLGRWTRERFRTELRLKWLLENRCTMCGDLNVSNFKVTNVGCVLAIMAESCPRLASVTFSGWKSFTSDDLLLIAEQFKELRRLDLSSINMDINVKSSVSIQALCLTIQLMKDRLTHLYLAHNKLAGIPQIVTALATFCPNLLLLDLSNVTTVANSHGVLHLEKLQSGCQKLKVLRITNSHITLGPATLEEQMSSPGFPDLEELSIAALSDEARLMNDDSLQRILKTSTKLQLLDVRGCTRLTHESMIRLPTWDLKQLFLSGCMVTRDIGSGLELIASKWAHSLIEFDLAWANVQQTIDNALRVFAEKGSEAAISHLNLCGSSVSQEAVKEVLQHCPQLNSINLASCRGLPRGVKRLMQGTAELNDLREALGVPLPVKAASNESELASNSSDLAASSTNAPAIAAPRTPSSAEVPPTNS